MNIAVYLSTRRVLNLALIVTWMALIFMGSSTPQADVPKQVSQVAKVLHLIEYAVLGFVVLPFVSRSKSPWAYAVAVCFAYAASDELHQLFVPGRNGMATDVLIDTVGASVGSFVSRRLMG